MLFMVLTFHLVHGKTSLGLHVSEHTNPAKEKKKTICSDCILSLVYAINFL